MEIGRETGMSPYTFANNRKYKKNVYKCNEAEEKPAPHNDAKQQSSRKCYNCGSLDHLLKKCNESRKQQPVFVRAAHTVLNDKDSSNEPLGDDGLTSEKQADQDDQRKIEVEVTDAE